MKLQGLRGESKKRLGIPKENEGKEDHDNYFKTIYDHLRPSEGPDAQSYLFLQP